MIIEEFIWGFCLGDWVLRLVKVKVFLGFIKKKIVLFVDEIIFFV